LTSRYRAGRDSPFHPARPSSDQTSPDFGWGFLFPLPTARPCGSAKRGQPQIFLFCVTLWASTGGLVSARAFAVPVPNGIGRKQKRATLASTPWKGCWGHPFSTAKARYGSEAAKKPSHVHNFGLSDWPSPFTERKGGDEVET
jgi:hypothetical protein